MLCSCLWLGAKCIAQEQDAQSQTSRQVVNGVEMVQGKDGLTVARTPEDFSSLTLKTSELVNREPVLGAHDENKDFLRELYQVQWRDNDPIDLYVIRPAGVKNPPVVLYLYGFPSDTDRFRNVDYCRRLTANGAAAVGFVSALTGQRYHGRPMKEWFVSELPESLATSVHDVQMVLNYLQTRGDLDMTRVGMFGQGSGGAIALLSASVDPRIKALDLLAPWGDWPDWLVQSTVIPPGERGTYNKPEFLKKLEPLEPVHALAGLKDRSIRIQFVDDPPPMKSTKALEAAAPKDATIIHHAGTRELLSAVSGGRLFQWLPQQLKAQGPGTGSTQAAVRNVKEGGSN
jgi:acetyl esterase/lipase